MNLTEMHSFHESLIALWVHKNMCIYTCKKYSGEKPTNKDASIPYAPIVEVSILVNFP